MNSNIKKYIFIVLFAFFMTTCVFSQNDINQNGIKTSVIVGLSADAADAKRYEIVSIGYNSQHWQPGGLIIIELFQVSYGTGYEKYIVENGYAQGANSGSPVIKLTDSQGIYHSGRITLGTATDLTTNIGGYINKQLPIFFDVRYYASYKIRITYLQEKVDTVTDINQIKINQSPIAVSIPDFSTSDALTYSLKISGPGNHYIQNGNVGIGTTNPTSKLTVAGNIASREVKVTVDAGADFVFEKDYDLPSLDSVDKFIKENKHLPEVASAASMQKDGINLSEMNIKLLQKIEELTLYMIEIKKENEAMKKDIRKLKTR